MENFKPNKSLPFKTKTIESPNLLRKSVDNQHRRMKGGVASSDFEMLFGNNQVQNQPNFTQKRDSYRSIGWGVSNMKLLRLPSLAEKFKNMKKTKSSMENHNKSWLNSNLKIGEHSLLSGNSSSGLKREPSLNTRDFMKQMDKEYSSTGAGGFLGLNGSFSNHIDRKLQLKPDLYHSMNMLGQKNVIMK